MKHPRISAGELGEIVAFLFETAGARADIAQDAAKSLADADLNGHYSHGSRQVASYVGRLQTGEIDGQARPQVISEQGALIRIDGKRAFGPIAGTLSAELGAAAAKKYGVAAVALTGSGHLGRNGLWPEVAARHGVASLHFINAPNAPLTVAPYGSATARLSNNPISLGVPGPNGETMVTDFAIGSMAINSIRRLHERGEKLPEARVIGPDGQLSDDPAAFLHGPGAMLPFGGFKGYALGVFAEILAGALAGGGVHDGPPPAKPMNINNMLSLYIDAGAFVGLDAYLASTASLGDFVRAAPQVKAGATTAIPGDRARAAVARQLAEGIEFDASLQKSLSEAAGKAGVTDAAKERWPTRFQ